MQATEEAIVNALVAGRGMTGMAGPHVDGLPLDRFESLMHAQPAEQPMERLAEPTPAQAKEQP